MEIVVPSNKPHLAEAASAAVEVFNSTDGQEFRALKARGATLTEICAWVDEAPDKASKRVRKELRYMEAYRTHPEDIARVLGLDGGQP